MITSYSIRRGSVVDVVQPRFAPATRRFTSSTARVWVQHFGATGRSLHRLSVFIGALTLLAMAALARELGLGRWSEPAALLWAVHPVLQFDARYARPMIGVMLGAILALWLMAIALRRDSRTAWGALLTIGLLGALWSPQFMLVWASLGAAVAIAPQWRRTRAAWLVLGAIAIAHGAVSGYTATATVRNPLTWIPPPQGFVWIGSFLDGIGGYGIPGASTNRIECFAYDSSMILPLCTIVAVLVGSSGSPARAQAQPVAACDRRDDRPRRRAHGRDCFRQTPAGAALHGPARPRGVPVSGAGPATIRRVRLGYSARRRCRR